MSSADSPPEPPPFPLDRKTWRFSMRTMMLGMTGFAIICGLFSTFPTLSTMILGAIWLVATGWLLTGIVFAKGDLRAFCIGAAVVVSSTWTGLGGQYLESIIVLVRQFTPSDTYGWPGSLANWLKHFFLLVSAVANGWFCIHARRYFERQANGSAVPRFDESR